MNYGRAIKICRAVRGMGQAEFAGCLSFGASHLSLIEAGKRSPSSKALTQICQALRVTPAFFVLLASSPKQLEDVPAGALEAILGRAFLDMLIETDVV